MRISLDDDQIAEIRTMIFSIVQDALKEINSTKPYLIEKALLNILACLNLLFQTGFH